MQRKSSPPQIAPLQRVAAEPITDADEQAALDKLRAPSEPRSDTGSVRPTPDEAALRLCRQLPAEERLSLVVEMAALLSTHERRELAERLLAELPADAPCPRQLH